MNVLYSWLKDYVDFDLAPEAVADALTSIGLEVGSIERVESVRGGLRGIVIGKVLTCVAHPDSDHLHITTVDLGGDVPEQIVCGAPNVAAGQSVVVATVGTTLYDGDKEFKIKKSKIRGVESMGMICAEDEIGIGTSHDGIIVIDPATAPAPGTPAADYYGIKDDYIIEVDLTPNRIDAACHYGVARDLRAYLAAHGGCGDLHLPPVDTFAIDDPATPGVSVTVDPATQCTRYSGITITGVTVAPSPDWLATRLTMIGLRPINNIVDITNYILHALGQPLHCFDRAKITGDTIHVTTCPGGTPFTTLDGVEHKLDERDVMVCNSERPMAMAGVFGGLDSGVTTDTTSVFIESACFNPTRVRRTARRHTLSTDSSFRFERGVDPNLAPYALRVAALMIKQLAGGTIIGDTVDIYPTEIKPYPVTLSRTHMDKLVGKHIDDDTIETILHALEIQINDKTTEGWQLAVPTYRVDVTRECDVIEDILRIYGYNNVEIPTALHASLSFKTPTDSDEDTRRHIADMLTARGYHEILNNSLTAVAYYQDLEPERCVTLLNPLSQDLSVMRRTLLFGGLETLAHNINRKTKDLALYETGNVYERNPQTQSTAERPLAPYSEHPRLALWLTGDTRPATWLRPADTATFYDLRRDVTDILTRLGLNPAELTYTPADSPLFATALTITHRSGKNLGTMGMVATKYTRLCGVKQTVWYAELDMAALMSATRRRTITYTDLPKTLPVRRDLALLLDTAVTFDQVQNIIRTSERRLLRDITLFDVYEGDKLPQGKKSYAVAITLQDNDKTLQDKTIDAVMTKIITNLKKQLGAELR